MLTTFDSAVDALQAAIAIQREHARFNDEQPPAERVALRVGMNTGEVYLHEGWDPRGYDAHLAQCVANAAAAGQIR